MEAASVVAFQVLTAELSAYGAPEELLERSRRAAHDEVRHARMMQRLAQRFGSEVSPRSVRVSGVRDLETIARENAVEGCVMETWGCLIGLHQARRARPGLRRVYRQIAADEARHAQLSWDIATWAETQLSPEAVARVNAAKERALAELEERLEYETDHESEATPAEEALGLPDSRTRRRLFGHLRQALWT
jgi:rubrerythrin